MLLGEYKETIRNRVADYVESEGVLAKDAFFQLALKVMTDYGIADSISAIAMQDDLKAGSKNIHLDAYSLDETEHAICLYINDYCDDEDPERLSAAALDKLYWKLFYFMETSCADNPSKYIDMSSEAYKAAVLIRNRMLKPLSDSDRVLKVHLVIVTNRELDTKLLGKDVFEVSKARRNRKSSKARKRIKLQEFSGRPVDIDIWPIDRFYETETSENNSLITIDFLSDYGVPGIPCLKGNVGDALDYEAYIGIIPGKLLADMYIEHGSHILEGNVRAFLGTKSAKGVNNGIKKTINTEPYNFFTYNNGIALTATAITTEEESGQLFLTGVTDPQIINGGQTTATLAEAVLKKTNATLSGIYVPFKLTVISDREKETADGILLYDQMIHDIARFANSQNKVTAADLFSNDPFHIWMEKASKRYFAPTVKYNIQTGWYYERARKKYQQEQFKMDGDELKRFLAKFPKSQIISKEQLAMYLTALAEKPHLCSKGKNWVMKEYGQEIGEIYRKDKARFNEYYFKKCVCAAIIYRTVDNYLEDNKRNPEFWYSAGGYKGNIVPYTVSKITASLPSGFTFNWPDIWNNQGLSDAFMKEIEKVTYMANTYFTSCTGVLVSEYCKRESSWITFRDDYDYSPSSAFLEELLSLSDDKALAKSAVKDQKEINDLMVLMDVVKKGTPYWQAILEKSQKENLLSSSELYYLEELIRFVQKGVIPYSGSGRVPAKTMDLINHGLEIEAKLGEEGIVSYFDADDDIEELRLNDYKMH